MAASAGAQETDTATSGPLREYLGRLERNRSLRVVADGQAHKGRFDSWDTTRVVLTGYDGNPHLLIPAISSTIPLARVDTVWELHSQARTWAKYFALTGAIVGAVGGAQFGDNVMCDVASCDNRKGAAVGALVGGLAGAGLGAVTGSLLGIATREWKLGFP